MNCPFCNKNSKVIIKDPDFDICICKKCSIAFTVPPPKPPEYENMDFNASINNDEQKYKENLPVDWIELIEIQCELIKKNLQPGSTILEIGCGEGILLYELKKNGYQVLGIEPSQNGCKKANQKGIEVIQGSFPNVKIDTKFNLIIMSHVLEHIFDLEQTILKIKEFIPNGYLMLTQSNFKGLIPRIKKNEWYAWVPDQHFWHFSLKGLKNYLKKYQLKKINHKYNSLVHPHGRLYRLSKLIPRYMDQFTILLKNH